MNKPLLTLCLLALFIVSCGNEVKKGPTDPVTNPPIPSGDKQVTLMLWGGFPCDYCSKYHPQIQSQLKNKLGKNFDKVDLQLWVPVGYTYGDRPTSEIAELYRKKLNLQATAMPDPWRWKNFRKYLKGTSMKLPAGILLDKDGQTLVKFPPGSTSFVPEEVVAAVIENLK